MLTLEMMSQVRKAQTRLAEIIRFLEVDVHECDFNLSQWKHHIMPTGWSNLDTSLRIGGIPRGSSTEIWAREGGDTLRFALKMARERQAKGEHVALLDPFGEFDAPRLLDFGLDPEKTIVLATENPEALAAITARLMENLDLLILPPGLTQFQWLRSVRNDPRGPENEPSKTPFQHALGALAWEARRTGASLLILREAHEAYYTAPLGVSQLRFRLLPQSGHANRRLRIEHNVFTPETVGQVLELGE